MKSKLKTRNIENVKPRGSSCRQHRKIHEILIFSKPRMRLVVKQMIEYQVSN